MSPLSIWTEHPRDLRTVAKRRGNRINYRVPVTIEWEGAPAEPVCLETGFTRVVNEYGCLLVSPKEIGLQQRLRVTNTITRQQASAEVVWKGTERPDGWDLGVKLTDSLVDFWGVDL
jgi:hypothetical protein